MNRRNERMEFPYGAPQPNMGQQQHHPTPVQPPMNVPQPPAAQGGSQQQTPTQTQAQPSRQRKRPAPNAAPSPATGAPAAPITPSQPPAPTPPAPQSAPVAQPPAAGDDVNSTPVQPPAKKSRTNTPWTPQEELRLKQMRDAGNSWAEIAKVRRLCSHDKAPRLTMRLVDVPYENRRFSEEALVQGTRLFATEV